MNILAKFSKLFSHLSYSNLRVSKSMTQQKKIEESLNQNWGMLAHILRSVPQAIFWKNKNGVYLGCNEVFAKTAGVNRPENIVGKTDFDLPWPREEAEAYRADDREVIELNRPKLHIIEKLQQADGRRLWVDTTKIPLSDEAGRVYGVLGVYEDITERKQAEDALRESQTFLETILEHSPHSMWVSDEKGTLIRMNQACRKMLRVTDEDLVGKYNIFEDNVVEQQGAMPLVKRVFEQGERVQFTLHYNSAELQTMQLRNTTQVIVDVTISPVLNAQKQVMHAIVQHHDITERKRALDALQEERLLTETLLRSLPGIFYLYTYPELRLVRWNKNHETLLNYDPEEMNNRSIFEWHPPETKKLVRQAVEVVMEKGENMMESPLLTKDGRLIPFLLTGNKLEFQSASYLLGVGIDVTERKRVEEALRESEAKMRSIVDNIGIGVALISPKMEVLELNQRMREWFPAVDSGQHPFCYRAFNEPPRDVVCDYCPTCKTLKDGLAHEAMTQTPRGVAIRNYRIISSPIFNSKGEVTAAIELVEDLTEHLSLESQLHQAQKMESVGRLAGGVAHDFNNMLGAILGHAEMAMMRCVPSEQIYADLKVIKQSALRSADLTRQLLAFARKQTVTPKVLDLNDTVAGMLKMLQRLIGEDIDFAWMPGAGLWQVKIDPSQIDQLLVNLCVNARDAIAGVGKITIETENTVFDEAYCAGHPGSIPGEYVLMAVSDNGCGMGKDVIDHIFEPFFTTKAVGKGSGLGLSTVYGIVRQNEGFINVYSETGKGTTFKIYLPRVVGGLAEPMVPRPAQMPKGRGETVLLVEDEAMILNMSRAMLEELGYRVLTAGTPSEALRTAKANSSGIQLLITDVVMPEMNGRDLAKLLSEINPNLKCLFSSGYTANVIAHHGVLDEGVHFLQKPFSVNDLATKVRRALEGE